MKGTITQYVTLGVMLLLLVLIVSLYPEQQNQKVSGQQEKATEVTKLMPTHTKSARTN